MEKGWQIVDASEAVGSLVPAKEEKTGLEMDPDAGEAGHRAIRLPSTEMPLPPDIDMVGTPPHEKRRKLTSTEFAGISPEIAKTQPTTAMGTSPEETGNKASQGNATSKDAATFLDAKSDVDMEDAASIPPPDIDADSDDFVEQLKAAWNSLRSCIFEECGDVQNVIEAMHASVGELVDVLEEEDEDELKEVLQQSLLPAFQKFVDMYICVFRKEIQRFGKLFASKEKVPAPLTVLHDEVHFAKKCRKIYASLATEKNEKKKDRRMKNLIEDIKKQVRRDPSQAKIVNDELKLISGGASDSPEAVFLTEYSSYFNDVSRVGKPLQQVQERQALCHSLQALLQLSLVVDNDPSQRDEINRNLQILASKNRPLAEHWYSSNRQRFSTWLDKLSEDLHDFGSRTQRRRELSDAYFQMSSITLADYNKVSLRYDNEQIRKNVRDWLCINGEQGAFKGHIFPVILNILKRGEPWDDLIEIGREEIKNSKLVESAADLLAVWTSKCLFSIVYDNSEPVVRFHIISDYRTGLPLVYPSWSSGQFNFNADVLYHLPVNSSVGVLSFALGSRHRRLGKTRMLNEMFKCGFDETPSTFVTHSTCDLDIGLDFEPRRNMVIADVHGEISFAPGRNDANFKEILLRMFPYWIIHVHVSEPDEVVDFANALQGEQMCPKGIFVLVRDVDSQASAGKFFELGDGPLQGPIENLQESLCGLTAVQCAAMQNLSYMEPSERNSIYKFQIRKALNRFVEDNRKSPGPNYGILDQNAFLSVLETYNNRLEKATANSIDSANFEYCSLPSLEPFREIENLMGNLFSEVHKLKDNFWNPLGLATRNPLIDLRAAQQVIEDPSLPLHKSEEAKKKEANLRLQLEKTQPTALIEAFLQIFESPNKILILAVLCVKLKEFSTINTSDDISRRKHIEDQLSGLSRQSNFEGESAEQVQLKDQLRSLVMAISSKKISLELLWREVLAFLEWGAVSHCNPHLNLTNELWNFISVAEPFELIDGDNLQIPLQSLEGAFRQLEKNNQRVLVISILGPQSSGKSTLLNYLFGCKFSTSKGRCTKGVYGTLQRLDPTQAGGMFDYLLVLDTEGLQSPEKEDKEFDRKIGLLILAISHVVLINVAKDMNVTMKEMLEVCLLSLSTLEKARMPTPELYMIFNQNSGDTSDKSLFMDQVKKVSDNILEANPDARDAANAMQLSSRHIKVLPLATNTEVFVEDAEAGQSESWVRQSSAKKFACESAQFAQEILASVHERVTDPSRKQQEHILESWLHMSHENWRTIQQYPDLYRFASVKVLQQFRKLTDKTRELEKTHLCSMDVGTERDQHVEEILVSNVISDRLLDNNHVKVVQDALCSCLIDFYDEKQEKMSEDLRKYGLVLNCDAELIDTHLAHIRQQVDLYREDATWVARSRVQDMQDESARKRGIAELDQLIRDFDGSKALAALDGETARTQHVQKEFGKVWNRLVEKKHEQFHVRELRQSSWTQVSRMYRQSGVANKVIGRDAVFEAGLLERLGNCMTSQSTVEVIGNILRDKILSDDGFLDCKDPGLRRFAREDPECSTFKTLMVQSPERYPYLSPSNLCNVVASHTEIVVDVKNHIRWDALKSWLCNQARDGKDAMLRLHPMMIAPLHNAGIILKAEFIREVEDVLGRNWVGSFFTSRIDSMQNLLKRYKGFSRLASEPIPVVCEKFRTTDLSKITDFDHCTWTVPVEHVMHRHERLAFSCRSQKWTDICFKSPGTIVYKLQPDSRNDRDSKVWDYVFGAQVSPGRHIKVDLESFVEKYLSWEAVFGDLEVMLDKNLQLCGCQVSLETIATVKKNVHDFVRERVNFSTELFGAVFDRNGQNLFHSFAMLHCWRRVCENIINRQRSKTGEFEAGRQQWCDYVLKCVFADPAGKTRASATRFVQDVFEGCKRSALSGLQQLTKIKLKSHEADFEGDAIREHLDQSLLFSEGASSEEVVSYVRQQAAYVKNHFEEKWNAFWSDVKNHLTTNHYVSDTLKDIQRFRAHITELQRFVQQLSMRSSTTSGIIVEEESSTYDAVYEREQDDVVAAHSKFFCDSLFGCCDNIHGGHWRWKDPATKRIWRINLDLRTNIESEVNVISIIKTWGDLKFMLQHVSTECVRPLLFPQFLQDLQAGVDRILETQMHNLTLSDEDFHVFPIREAYRMKAVGCTCECPTCGRKCDQPDPQSDLHVHACSSGHQLRAIAGVTVGNGMPSFQTCDEIPDDNVILELPSKKWTKWGKTKNKYPNWRYQFDIDAETTIKNIRKFRSSWEFHGKAICSSLKKDGHDIKFSPVRVRDLHLVLVLDNRDLQKTLEKAKEFLVASTEARNQYCSIVVTDNVRQQRLIAEKLVSEILKDQSIQLDRTDERETDTTVANVLQQAATTYLRQTLRMSDTAPWPRAAIDQYLNICGTVTCKEVYSNKWCYINGKFSNPLGLAWAQRWAPHKDPAQYMKDCLVPFDTKTFAKNQENISFSSSGKIEDQETPADETDPKEEKRLQEINRIF